MISAVFAASSLMCGSVSAESFELEKPRIGIGAARTKGCASHCGWALGRNGIDLASETRFNRGGMVDVVERVVGAKVMMMGCSCDGDDCTLNPFGIDLSVRLKILKSP